MQTIAKGLSAIALDVVGLAFAGVAVYGLATGRVSGADLTIAVGLAGTYLGVKLPTPTVGAS